jgi:hypothetical protein
MIMNCFPYNWEQDKPWANFPVEEGAFPTLGLPALWEPVP